MNLGYKLISKLPWIIGKADKEVQLIVEEALFKIEFGAAARSRVDTGQMMRGWQSEVTGKHEGVVYNMVEHSYYNEYGTVMMTAQPMLTPAIEEVEPVMLKLIEKVYTG
jgi:hypothetical protein